MFLNKLLWNKKESRESVKRDEMCLKWTNNVNDVFSNMAARNVIHLRGHPLDQEKCPLNRGVPSMEVGLGFVNNNQK